MALRIKSLGSGTIGSAGTTTLYTADATALQQKSAIIGSIIMCCFNTSSINVKLLVTPSGGAAVQFYPTTALIGTGTKRLAVTDRITLGPGDKLEVNLTGTVNTGAIMWCVSGFERDTGT
jgi:hypothetical protein